MCTFKYLRVLFLFFVITTNVYSQKKSDDLRDSVNHYIFLRDSLRVATEDYYSMIMSIVSFCSETKDLNRYFVLFFDGKDIRQGILKENDGDLYTKYDPNKKDDNEKMRAILETKSKKKVYDWVAQELKKGSIISINNAHKKGMYICKSFSNI